MTPEGSQGYLLILVATPALLVALHGFINRIPVLSERMPRQVIPLICCAVGVIPVGLALWAGVFSVLPQNRLFPYFVYSATIYLCLSYCYFHIFNMSETARRVRILYELHSGKMDPNTFQNGYDASSMLDNRLERLLETKQLRLTDGRYLIDSRILLYAAKILFRWGSILNLKDPTRIISDKSEYGDGVSQ